MKQSEIWSLRLGFSRKEANKIEQLGFEKFLRKSMAVSSTYREPAYLKGTPRTIQELIKLRKQLRGKKGEKFLKQYIQLVFNYKSDAIERCDTSEYPLAEKMMLFWQNHFVSTFEKVRVPYWMYEYEQIIRENSFGNYKTLVKEIVYSNAMLAYLDNNENRKDKLNENLGRELLELFTLGEGNYTEKDIKNTARALAGLTIGNGKGQYRRILKDNGKKTVFGKSGNFIVDDVIDTIFEQENTAYFITEKILRWFIYDNPPEDLIKQYGDRFKALNFEIAPFLEEVFAKEYDKTTAGLHIKSPLEFVLQVQHDLKITPNYKLIAFFLHQEGMDLFDQPNVKGWPGGRAWLTTQTYLSRHDVINFFLINDDRILRKISRKFKKEEFDLGELSFQPKLNFSKNASAKEIKTGLVNQLLFQQNQDIWEGMEQVMPYDFDPKDEYAEQTVRRLFSYITQLPEFQLI